ncbi:MAG: caspase family protein [Armatimonadetes bacterium]|nr:caspase family protein [Armatimonadota bacterium]
MKKSPRKPVFAAVVVLLLLFASGQARASSPPRTLALLVGINRYENFRNLNGCWNDVLLMERVLKARYEFPQDSILKLGGPDVPVTRDEILKAFREHLIARASEETTVVFYYAGHGTRVPDQESMSGVSSGIVPSDTPSPLESREGFLKTIITGKEMKQLAASLSAKTRRVTLIFDSCHSGAMGRKIGGGTIRQVDFPFEPTFKQRTALAPEASDWLPRGEASRNRYVLLAACRTDQAAVEDRFDALEGEKGAPGQTLAHGRFTRILGQVLLMPGRFTTGELMDYIRQNIGVERQNPQIEGNRGQEVFGGVGPDPRPYFLVEEIGADGLSFTMNGGLLHGIAAGSEVTVFPSEASEPDPGRWVPIAKAVIAEARDFDATAKASEGAKPISRDRKSFYRVFVTALIYGENRLRVRLDKSASALGDMPFQVGPVSPGRSQSTVPSQSPVHFLKPGSGEPDDLSVTLTASGYEVFDDRGLIASGMKADEVRLLLQRFARRKLVLALNNLSNPERPIRLSLHRIEEEDGRWKTREELPRNEGGGYRLRPGDQFAVRMYNKDPNRTWYVTLLDLTPDGQIQVQYPLISENVEDNKLAPERHFDVPFKTDEPTGREVFVAIATQNPVDLGYVVSRDARFGSRNLNDPLAQLLRHAMEGTSQKVPVPPRVWSSTQLTLTVEAK